MESEDSPPLTNPVKCCDCGCNCLLLTRSQSGTYLRSVKRKYDEFEEESQFTVLGLVIPQNARVGIENECMALRETLTSQQEAIQDLLCELEQERNASSSAANEAMSMILRLQREKAEIEMEAKQFKRFTEEKMAHDQLEILELEELLYKREHSIEALTCEVQAYKHRMMSYGLTEEEVEAEVDELYLSNEESQANIMTDNLEGQPVLPGYKVYPPLKCNINESHLCLDGDDETDGVEKHAFGETPYSRDQLKDLEYRINQLERSPRSIHPDRELDKVIVGQSPGQPRHVRGFSADSLNSPFAKEMGTKNAAISPKFGSSIKKTEYSHLDVNSNLRKVDNASEDGNDLNDRVYTIDSIHRGASVYGSMDHRASAAVGGDDYMATKDSQNHSYVRDLEIQKLYARLNALETDRETMRQAIVSVGTDKAQLVLLKEIAQNLCKEMSPSRRMSVQEKSVTRSFPLVSIFKWIISFIFWRRNARRCRYMFGLSTNKIGLQSLLDRGPRAGPWRIVSNKNLRN